MKTNENEKIKNYLEQLESDGTIGLLETRLGAHICDGYYYHEVIYDVYAKKETTDTDVLNVLLENLMMQELKSEKRGHYPQKFYNVYPFKGKWPQIKFGYLEYVEDIAEIIQTGKEYLRIFGDENKDFEIGTFNSKKQQKFTQTSQCIRRKTSVNLYPNQYFAERKITSINEDAVELMQFRTEYKNKMLLDL